MTFQAYPTYRDSGVEWLGAIPAHWGVKQLRYLGRFRKGLTITKADLADTGIPCLNYGEVHSLYPFEVNQDVQPLKSVPPEYLETDPSACIKHGDFVFADTSEDLDGVGNFTHVSGMEPLFAGYHTIIYSLDSETSSRFLAYCLDSFGFRTQLRLGVKGVKVFSVTQEILRGGTAWLPSTAEQTQIARFLDHETARIDALIEEQQRLIELLKEKRQAVISHAVTKGLDPTVPMKHSGVEWLGEVPAHWDVVALKRIVEVKDGTHATPNYVDPSQDVFPLITSKDFNGSAIDFDSCKYISRVDHEEIIRRSDTQRGDVLMSMIGGNIGKALIVETVRKFSIKNVALFKTVGDGEKAKHILFFLESRLFEQQVELISRGGAQGFLGLGDIRALLIPRPPAHELTDILHCLAVQIPKLDSLIDVAGKVIQLMNERRSALISAAVTGKIDVRGWQPPVSTQAPKLEVAEAN